MTVAAIRLWSLVAVACAFASAPLSSAAQLKLCNHYPDPIVVAVGFYTSGSWVSRGWYHIESGSCSNVIRSLTNRYYYVHRGGKGFMARLAENGPTDHVMCVKNEGFMIVGTDRCKERGYEARFFSQVDVKNYDSYQLDFVDPNHTRDAVKSLSVRTRSSLLDRQRQVLMLTNRASHYIEFDLRCYRRSGGSMLFSMGIGGGETKEIGFLQGWTGNFVSGERCEAHHDGERLWSYKIP